MEQTSPIQELLNHLSTPDMGSHPLPAAALNAIAQSRPLLAELAAVSYALTGEPSMIEPELEVDLTCAECQAQLDAYVEDEIAGIDIGAAHPQVTAHLRTCPTCLEQFKLLREILSAEQPDAPAYLSFGDWFQQQPKPQTPRWETVAHHVYSLLDEVTIAIQHGKALFVTLASGLQPQMIPAATVRSTPSANGAYSELLVLPHAETNLAVKVHLGPVRDGLGTLVLETSTILASQPIAQVRVMLRDAEGGLLESALTDAEGFVFFHDLDAGKYHFQVDHAGQIWNFALTLQASTL